MLLFDRHELIHEFKSTRYLSDHLEFSDIVEVIVKNQSEDNDDNYFKADIWHLIESSSAFSSEDFIMSVSDEYLSILDIMIETFTDFLFSFILNKSGLDLRSKKIKKISFNNNYVIIEI